MADEKIDIEKQIDYAMRILDQYEYEPNPYVCTMCGKRFATPWELYQHKHFDYHKPILPNGTFYIEPGGKVEFKPDYKYIEGENEC